MRFLSLLSSFLLAGAVTAQSATPSSSGAAAMCTPASTDNKAVQLAWHLQFMLERFYASSHVTPMLVSSMPNSSSVDYSTNLRGVQQQNHLGARAIQQLGAKVPGFTTPRCNYSLPTTSSGPMYLKYAAELEQNVCGAFIGLAGYTQKPEISFLFSRLAAEHAAHATWLGSHVSPVFFQSNSTALLSAYSPDWVLKSGNKPGMLGLYLHSCASTPPGPCDNKVLLIGPLGANLTSPSASSSAFAASSSSLLFGSSGVGYIGGGIFSSMPASSSASASATP